MKDKIKRVIIWGHFSGTQSYIHNAYFIAFKRLGFKTYWINSLDNFTDDLSDTLFFTEDQAKEGMPMRKDCWYVLHNINNEPFNQLECKILNLCLFVEKPLLNGISHNYPGGSIEKINDFIYYDILNKALYQPWATNLLPEQIDVKINTRNTDKEINYVGSVWQDNINEILPLIKSCEQQKIKFNIYGWVPFLNFNSNFNFVKHIQESVAEEKAYELVRGSYIYPDVRGKLHLDLGYTPCRIFKNISMGCIPTTNSISVNRFFDNLLPFCSDSSQFVEITDHYFSEQNTEQKLFLINEVKTKHTYINRIQEILKFFEILY